MEEVASERTAAQLKDKVGHSGQLVSQSSPFCKGHVSPIDSPC